VRLNQRILLVCQIVATHLFLQFLVLEAVYHNRYRIGRKSLFDKELGEELLVPTSA
jgi:hypothetical protein